MTKIVAISDTHLRPMPDLGEGDILVHCGDATMNGTEAEVIAFGHWLVKQRFTYKIFVPGNHDFLFERNRQEAEALLAPTGVEVLIDQQLTLNGITFFGTPWVPNLPSWAFHHRRGDDFSHVPPCHVLVSHGPPWGILDNVDNRVTGHVGSKPLRDRVDFLRPAHHIFGHIHEDAGKTITRNGTVFANVAAVNERYQPLRRVGYEINL